MLVTCERSNKNLPNKLLPFPSEWPVPFRVELLGFLFAQRQPNNDVNDANQNEKCANGHAAHMKQIADSFHYGVLSKEELRQDNDAQSKLS